MSETKGKRRLYSPEEKLRLLDEADKPGESIGTVARKHGVSPSIMFKWRQMREGGALTGLKAGEELVPASEMRAARAKIRELQRLLGKKNRGNRNPQRWTGVPARKKWIPRVPWSGTRNGR